MSPFEYNFPEQQESHSFCDPSILNVAKESHIENHLVNEKGSRALGVVTVVLFVGILLSFLVNFGVTAYLGTGDLVEDYFDGEEHGEIVFSGFADTFYLSKSIRQNIAYLDYYLFNRLPSPEVILGDDSFLFPTRDAQTGYNYVADYLGEMKPTPQELKDTYDGIRAITSAYANADKQCYIVIIPNAQTVYSEKMPDYMGNISDQTRLKMTTKYLSDDIDNYLDLTSTLISAKENGELYNNTEDSLNSLGAYYAYLAVLDMLPDDATKDITSVKLSENDLVSHLTVGKELAKLVSLENTIKNRTISLSTDFEQKYLILRDLIGLCDVSYAKIQYKSELPETPRIQLQFASEWDRILMIDYFSNTFGYTVYRTAVDYKPEVLSKTDASYVILFLHEKDLGKLSDGSMLP